MRLTLFKNTLLALSIFGLTSVANAQSWWPHDPMPTARERFAAAAAKHNTSNYAIFAFGGTNGGLTVYDSVEMFNPLTGTWSVRGPLPAKRCRLAAATADGSSGERIYLFGGSPGSAPTTTCWAYDAVNDTWDTSLPPLPAALNDLAATTGTDGKIYVFGGHTGPTGLHVNSVFAFDPVLESWNTSLTNMPTTRSMHGATTGCDGRIYVAGGGNSGGALMPMHVYDIDTDMWLTTNSITSSAYASIPGPRDLEVALTTGRDGKIYMIGGEGYPNETGALDSYDPLTNLWTSETAQPTTRNSQCAVGLGNAIYTLGGWKKFGGVQVATESWGGLANNTNCGGIVHTPPPGTVYCDAAPNSVSLGGSVITGFGTQSAAAADIRLSASPVPQGTPGVFFYGPNQIEVPFGDGFRCVGGSIKRLPVSFAQGNALSTTLDFSSEGGVPSDFHAGAVWNFQAWFRDTQAGQSGFNLSNAYTIHFLP